MKFKRIRRLKHGTMLFNGIVYPTSQFKEVFRAFLRNEPLPEPKGMP